MCCQHGKYQPWNQAGKYRFATGCWFLGMLRSWTCQKNTPPQVYWDHQEGWVSLLALSPPDLCSQASVQFSRSVMSDSLQPHELQHVGSHRVGHDWSNLAAAATSCKVTRQSHNQNIDVDKSKYRTFHLHRDVNTVALLWPHPPPSDLQLLLNPWQPQTLRSML